MFIPIFTFIIGAVLGVALKYGLDYYVEHENRVKQTKLDMEDILLKFKAIELMKSQENKKTIL